jgi:predicted nucleotidyltransferase
MLHPYVQKHLSEIKAILTANRVKKAFIFGSACTDRFDDKSDIDIVLDFQDGLDPITRGELWWKLLFSLEDTLKRPVDILTGKSLKNPYLIKEINTTMHEIL